MMLMLFPSSLSVLSWQCVLLVLVLVLVPEHVLVAVGALSCPTGTGSENGTSTSSTGSDFCGSLLYPGSKCVNGFCSNPFEQGCLYTLLNSPEQVLNAYGLKSQSNQFSALLKKIRSQKRICNSQDPPDAEKNGVCANYTNHPNYSFLVDAYTEVRIHGQNWASSVANAWMLQMILSEILMVPVSLETGGYDLTVDFYDPQNTLQFVPDVDHWETLTTAADAPNGDCQQVQQQGSQQKATNKNQKYWLSCAHVIPEYWDNEGSGQNTTHGVDQMQDMGIIERTQPLGAVGYRGLYVTKFTAVEEPSITSYLGLTGEQTREKLADLFKYPTTWKDYCEFVSNNSCTEPDHTAQRPPRDQGEGERYHVKGLYKGYFRTLTSNNCTTNPTTCTGHVADVPCLSTLGPSLLAPWIYHLNIPLTSQQYTYPQRLELWDAANATKSHFLTIDSAPDGASAKYASTETELLRITFPNPTLECRQSRENYTQFFTCHSDNPLDVFGKPEGACDYFPYSLQMLLATSLRSSSKPSNQPAAVHSPAFDAIRDYRMSHLQMGEILKAWVDRDIDSTGFDPRLATCKFFYSHLDEIIEHVIPPSYPRVLQDYVVYQGALDKAALTIGGFATLMTIVTSIFVFMRRESTVMKHAQVDFLFILLLGLLLVSCASIVNALEPSNGSCVASVWLLELGYTLELVPLIVKVTAINRLLSAAKKMKRVQIKRANLFAVVIGFATFTIIGMTVWTIVDPPKPRTDFTLEDQVNDQGETLVAYSRHCSSESDYWLYTAMLFHFMLLMWAAVLAFQTRRTPQRFRESTVLAAVIYSQCAFVAFRVVLLALASSTVSPVINSGLVSIATALDSLVTLCIYFIPKLFFFQKATSEGSSATAPKVYQWPPSSPPTLPSNTNGYVSSDNESAGGEHNHNNLSNHKGYQPKQEHRRDYELLQEEKSIATRLIADLQTEKESMRREMKTLSDENEALNGRVEELEEEVALLSNTSSRNKDVEETPPDEDIEGAEIREEEFFSTTNGSLASSLFDDHMYV
ncbi:Metabotropic glutamate receptor-like protein [Seminavis robusta]|uniref:Metabotropic glutamate receptor-like protein n=1 Tax=Seminavis robusta TaxID=568900 RepID=A0A9N8H0J2_9STRA|nr:Metabotropic glutamate receptor-like protein [Seminavis robusta]|eukprot:Sro3_g002160.1 Metabotropic glutamate receptor-like protein (1032) ;mRNA; r:71681-75084